MRILAGGLDRTMSLSALGHLSDSRPAGPTGSPLPRWRRWPVPSAESPRHAIRALLVGFLLEALTEMYQLASSLEPVRASPLGYSLGLATTILGFYFLWRGSYEWKRLGLGVAARRPRRSAGESLAILVGGVFAAAAWSLVLGSGGVDSSPGPLAWVVGGVMVLAVGGFFLSLARRVAPFQGWLGRSLAWAAFAWSLGVSSVAGLVLGRSIVGLFIDFFTSWTRLILALSPFIVTISPLFVAFALVSASYADAYARAPRQGTQRLGPSTAIIFGVLAPSLRN